MKKTILFLLLLAMCFAGLAQGDAPRYSRVAGYGFIYKRFNIDSILIVPLSTSPHVPYREGGLRWDVVNKSLQGFNGTDWLDFRANQINDTAFVFGKDTIRIKGTGSTGGGGSVTLISTGLWALGGPINSTGTISVDTSAAAAYLIRRKDSLVNYVTPTMLEPYRKMEGQLGVTYSSDNFVNLNDFTQNSVTASTSGGKILLSGGSGTYTKTLDLKDTSCLTYDKRTIRFIVTSTPSGTTYGIGFGKRSVNANGLFHSLATIDLSNGATSGALRLIGGSANTQLAISTNGTIALNDTILLTVERIKDTVKASYYNKTQGIAKSVSYTYDLTSSATVFLPNTGVTSIFTLGGTQSVDSIAVSSKEIKNATLMIQGNSKAVAYFAGNYTDVFGVKIGSVYPTTIIHAGGSDKVSDMLSTWPEIKALAPKNILLADIMSNSQRFGVSSATYQAEYQRLVDSCERYGIKVYHGSPMYETSINLSGQRSFVNGTYSIDRRFDFWSPLAYAPSRFLSADGVHPNAAGNDTLATVFINEQKIFGAVNSSSAGGGGFSGTTNYVPKFTSPTVIGNSSLQEATTMFISSKPIQSKNAIAPGFSLHNTSGGSNSKVWNIYSDNGSTFTIATTNDAESSNTPIFQIDRAGAGKIYTPTAAPVLVGTSSATGSYPLQVSGSSYGSLYLNSTNSSGNFMAFANSGTVKSYIGNGVSVGGNSGNLGIRSDSIYLSTTATGTSKFLFDNTNGKFYAGSFTDRGAFNIQNSGGFWQSGPFKLSGLIDGTSSDSILVVKDSIVKKIAASAFAAPAIPQSLIPFGSVANAQTTSANLRYVDSMSTLSSIGLVSKSYVQVGDSSVNVQSSKTSIFFGNSLFAGTTINPSYLRAATQIANLTNTQEENRAIGGTRMRALTGTDSSMENRVYIIPTFNAGVFKYLFFEYGPNDILSTSVDTAAYRTAYNGVIDNATGKGWPLANIVVVGPGILIDANPTIQARVAQIASITKDLATKKGVVYADTYKAMTARGGTALLTTDGVHHTERGVEVFVDAVTSAIGGIGGTARVNGYLTAGMLNLYQMKNPGNASVLTAYDSTYRPFVELRGKYQGTNQDAFGLGLDAMKGLTTGINNVAIGGKSMQAMADGSGNTAIGFNTLNAAVSSASNTAVGLNVLRVATSNENTGVGRDALYSLTTGTGNTSIGYYSLRSLVNSSFNSAFGYYSFNSATGGNNAGLGANSGRGTTSGANNTAVGATALFSNQTGAANTGVGYRALRGAGGDNNTAVGSFAFDSLTSSAVANVGIGHRAGYKSKGVLANTFIGPFAGQNNTTGNQNTGIGGYNGKDSTLNKQVWLSTGDQVVSYYADVPNSFSGAFTESPQYAWDINGKLGIRSVSNGTGSDSVLVINNNEVKKVSSTLFGSLAVPADRLVFGSGSATTHSVNFTVDSNTTVKNLNVGVQSGTTGFVNLGNSNGSAANGVLANGTLVLQSTTSNVNYNAQPGFIHAWQFGALGGSLSKRMELNIQQLEVKTNLFIDSVNNGTSSDSLLVINSREVKKVAAPVLDAADYTPTLTGITNVDGVTLTSAHYMRINDQVTVDLMISIDPTTLATNTNVDITLPIASTMTNLTNLTGIITSATGGTGNVVAVGNKARIGFEANTTSNQVYNVHYMYRIQ